MSVMDCESACILTSVTNMQERNIILALTHEFRQPSSAAVSEAAGSRSAEDDDKPAPVNMTSRFIGLVVVPGQHIAKIELDEVPTRLGIA